MFAAQKSTINLTSAGVGTGVGVGGPGVGVGAAKTVGGSTSLLAQQLAPPAAPTNLAGPMGFTIGLFVGFAGCLMVASAAAGFGCFLALALPIICGLVAAGMNRQNHRENVRVFAEQMATWDPGYVCLRCGTRFELSNALDSPPLDFVDARTLLHQGDKIGAARLVIERTGMGLGDAIELVESWKPLTAIDDHLSVAPRAI